jgi:GNAT superfamily N-acetyltransferase
VTHARVRLVERDATPPELRREIGMVLEAAYDLVLPRERGWIQMEPEFRALAFDGESVVGSCGACRVAAEPPLVVYGFADVAVAEQHRRRGIARALVRAAVEEAERRGGDVLLVATAILRAPFRELGFAAAPRGRVYYVRDGAEHLDPGWMLRSRDGVDVPPRLRIEGPF